MSLTRRGWIVREALRRNGDSGASNELDAVCSATRAADGWCRSAYSCPRPIT